MSNPQTADMFKSAMSEVANGPRLNSFQDLTESLLRRLSEKGLTLDQCADRKMLARSRSTLEGHCRKFGIRFPDFIPSNMMAHVQFIPSGDYLNLTGEHVPAVAAALGFAVTGKGDKASVGVPVYEWDGAKAKLLAAGFKAKKGKAPKKKGNANG